MNKHTFLKFCPLILFALLAIFLLQTLWTGAQIYQSMYHRESESRIFRTASQYLSTRLAQTDGDDISIGEFHAIPTLFLADGTEFVTLIYCYDGYLRELYSVVGADVVPDAGEKLLPLDGFAVEDKDGLLSLRITRGNNEITVYHAVGEEAHS